jgi:hypothetical protein
MHRRMRRRIIILGSVRPAWVAAGAIIDEDFVNGLYWPRPITSEILDTRASAKYVTDAAGLLIPVLANVIPISNAGMLIEPARTNVLQNSAVLNGAPWADASTGTTTRTANAAVAPDGTTTATQLVGNDANTYWFSGFQSPPIARAQRYRLTDYPHADSDMSAYVPPRNGEQVKTWLNLTKSLARNFSTLH